MKIALVTDTHISPKDRVLAENWDVVARWLDNIAPDLVVHLGDITADGVNDGAALAFSRALFQQTGRDFLFLPGNHDIGDGPSDEGARAEEPLDLERLAEYRGVFGPDWWSFHVGDWQILGLNAQLLGSGDTEETAQLAWLDRTLGAAEGPVGVMIHKPLHPVTAASVRGRYPPRAAREVVVARLQRRDLRFVICGHTHQALAVRSGSVNHVWVPSTSFCIPEAVQETVGEKRVGAMLLELDGPDHRLTTVTPLGLKRHNLLDLDHIYPKAGRLRAELGPAAML